MTAEISKHFTKKICVDVPLDQQLNEFLQQHKNYSVKTISFYVDSEKYIEHLFVVFTVDCSIK